MAGGLVAADGMIAPVGRSVRGPARAEQVGAVWIHNYRLHIRPTRSGKTHRVRTTAERLGVPVASAGASKPRSSSTLPSPSYC